MTELHPVRVYRSEESLPRTEQLAWKIAEVATDRAPLDAEAVDMAVNRVIDNASVAAASLTRSAPSAARQRAARLVIDIGAVGALDEAGQEAAAIADEVSRQVVGRQRATRRRAGARGPDFIQGCHGARILLIMRAIRRANPGLAQTTNPACEA